MSARERCRTAALGGHGEHCDHCAHRRSAYNSCRTRPCPTCPSLAKAQWLAEHRAEVLPVDYSPRVFTVPDESAALASQSQASGYGSLLRAAAETRHTSAAAPTHVGAESGLLAVRHPGGQTWLAHPPLPWVVPGSGPSLAGRRWVACRPGFCLPGRVLSRLFRRRLLEDVQAAVARPQLPFFSARQSLTEPPGFAAYLAPLPTREWVVYARRPFGGPHQLLDYLGRYPPRVAIAHHRWVSMEEGQVSCRWRDSRQHKTQPLRPLPADASLRRFLLPLLPAGFQRMRPAGGLGNRHRAPTLTPCGQWLAEASPLAPPPPKRRDYRTPSEHLTGRSLDVWPVCQRGRMRGVAVLPPRGRNALGSRADTA